MAVAEGGGVALAEGGGVAVAEGGVVVLSRTLMTRVAVGWGVGLGSSSADIVSNSCMIESMSSLC